MNNSPREVVRCRHCSLVQFKTRSGYCRRCPARLPFTKVFNELPEKEPVPIAAEPNPMPDKRYRKGRPRGPAPLDLRLPSIGLIVRRLRIERGWTQDEFANIASVPRSYVSRIEAHRVLPGPLMLIRLAAALEVDVLTLIPRPHGSTEEEIEFWFRKLDVAQRAQVLEALARNKEATHADVGTDCARNHGTAGAAVAPAAGGTAGLNEAA